jgi:hypothetical protein
MTQLQVQTQTLSNQELNRKLAELMGYTVEKIEKFHRLISPVGKVGWAEISEEIAWNNAPFYCTDPAASLEVEKIAIEHDFDAYVQNLAIVKWGEPDDDVEDTAVWNKTMRYSIAELLTASPRERAEAAYMTLQSYQVDKQ